LIKALSTLSSPAIFANVARISLKACTYTVRSTYNTRVFARPLLERKKDTILCLEIDTDMSSELSFVNSPCKKVHIGDYSPVF
jgi:hypothetical protein